MNPTHQPATAQQIERLRELEAKATPGPWGVNWGSILADGISTQVAIVPSGEDFLGAKWIADKALIAESRNLLPALLNSHAALVAANESLNELLDLAETDWHCAHCGEPVYEVESGIWAHSFRPKATITRHDHDPEPLPPNEDVRAERLAAFKALENCYMTACRRARGVATPENADWNHIKRFCEAVGLRPNILRAALATAEEKPRK